MITNVNTQACTLTRTLNHTYASAVTHAPHTQTNTRTHTFPSVRVCKFSIHTCADIAPCSPSYKTKKKKKKTEKKRNEKILDTSWLFRHSAFLRHRFTLRFIYKRQSLWFVTISTSFSFTCTAIVKPVKNFFFFDGWIGNSMRIMMIWLVIRFE